MADTRFIADGDKIVIRRTHDPNPTLEAARILRQHERGIAGENRLVGRVPGWLVNEWLKDAGVRWDDVEARQEVLRSKLMSSDFDAFRVWRGTF